MKKLIISSLVFLAATTGVFFSEPLELKADCEHYFETIYINGVGYLYEYNCDGSIYKITVIDD